MVFFLSLLLTILFIFPIEAMRDPALPLQMDALAECELAESKAFLKQIEEKEENISEIKETISFDQYLEIAIDLGCEFLNLPKESRNELLKLHRMGDISEFPKDLPNESNKDKLIREAVLTVNWLENPEKIFDFVEQKGEQLAVIKDYYEMGKEQFNQLESEEAKKFIRELFQYLYENRAGLTITEQMFDHLLAKFNGLPLAVRKDLLTKITSQTMAMYLRMYYEMCGFGQGGGGGGRGRRY